MSWFSHIKSFFEKKSNNSNSNTGTKGKSDVSGIVRDRMKFYEELQVANGESTVSDTADVKLKMCKGSFDLPQNHSSKSNIELTPSMVTNKDNICIYNSGDDAVYGSFKKRPKFINQESSTEKEVIMRLKVREDEHMGINRYQSILKAPLSQQLVLSKFNDTPMKYDQESSTGVNNMIEKWNQQSSSKKKQEKMIDIDLLNSMCKKMTDGSSPEKSEKVLQLLQGNQPLKWAETERVKAANILKNLTRDEINFQESQFELIASEASYYQSLNVLVDKFYHSPFLAINNKNNEANKRPGIRAIQKEHLFSNILKIHSISGKFLADLEKRFSQSIVMKDVCDIVTKYAKNQFQVYVPYLQNQKFQTEAYNELKKSESIAKIIEELESQPECMCLSLDSFLLLPMQRLLRIQLLVKTIKKNVLKGNTLSSDSAEIALLAMENIINQCSEMKGQMDERQRMLEIVSSLTSKTGNTIPAISSGILLHEGEVRCHRKSASVKSFRVYDAWIILTNEYFLITKVIRSKKVTYLIEDMCTVKDITIDESAVNKDGRHDIPQPLSITFHKTVTYVIETKTRDEYAKLVKELSQCLKKKLSNNSHIK